MNKKGQIEIGIGSLISVFIVVLVGTILLVQVAQDVGISSNTVNHTLNIAAGSITINTTIDMEGQDLITSAPLVVNGTGGQTVTADNYLIEEAVSTSTGVKTITFRLLKAGTYEGANLTANGANGLDITYVFGPDGYISSSGARSMASIIVVFFALVIGLIALEPIMKSRILEMGK